MRYLKRIQKYGIRKEYEKDIKGVYEILEKGSIEARKTASQTLNEVKNAMKINYFEDRDFIEEQAKKYNVPVPYNSLIVDLIHAIEGAYKYNK